MSALRFRLVVMCAMVGSGSGMCPAGFGDDQSFPTEWKIPQWPKGMSLDEASKLRTVTLGGFKMLDLNEEYLEGPGEDFQMQGAETYWQASGKYFMYYCQRFRKWRIAAISAFGKNMEMNCFAFVSDAFPGRNIRNETLIKGWIEVEDGNWVHREDAGVVELGTLGDQMDIEEEAEDGACADGEGDGEDLPFGKKDKSNCPVMPHIRKAKDKVVEVTKKAGKWARRLFPKLLGAPDEEDVEPEESELFKDDPTGAGERVSPDTFKTDGVDDLCDPETQNGCGYKQKFYIERQRKETPDKRKQELARLDKMQEAVMKPDASAWLKVRINILRKMIDADKRTEL